jgi:NAD(P)H dehydrogenase (quinone)
LFYLNLSIMAEVNIAIIYYSATSTTYQIARAIEEGAKETGAQIRFRKVKELAPKEAIEANEGWLEHYQNTQDIPEASLDDLEWADAIVFGSPTRYGLPTAQLKQFIDTTGPLWNKGKLANKIVSAFASAATPHGGHETTITAICNTFYHWGAIIVPPGYNDSIQFKAGTPYGASFISENGTLDPDETALASAKFQGKRVAQVAATFKKGWQ